MILLLPYVEFSVVNFGENATVSFVTLRAHEAELRNLVESILHYFSNTEIRERYMIAWVTISVVFKGYDVREIERIIYTTAWEKGITVKKVIV